jgi:hypothetical protein
VSTTAIGIDDRAGWERQLARVPHAFFHTWDYCHAVAAGTGAPTYLWCHEDAGRLACCPVSERRKGDAVDVVTPLGFSGFTASGPLPGLAAAWRDWCIGKGYVCAYLGLNPLFADPAWFDPAEVHAAQTLYLLDLRQGPEALRAGLQASLRHKLREAAAVEHSDDVGVEDMLRFFVDAYPACFAARGAGGAYRLDAGTLEALARSRHAFLLGVRGADGYESVTLFGRTAASGDAFLNVCTEAGRIHAFTLLWHGALRLQTGGVPFLNLGGGITEGDGVAQFKRRFGGQERRLVALRQVFDAGRYRALCVEAGVDPQRDIGYFPAYRAPVRGLVEPR